MSGGHGDAHAGHGGGHGHGHGHGHDAHGAGDPHAGPAELPPVPATRSISPARADFEQPWPGRLLLWPVVWVVVAFGFYGLATRYRGHVELETGHADAGPGAAGHGAAGHGAVGEGHAGEAGHPTGK